MNMKPQQNEDLKVPDQYFEDVKLHWRNVLEVEDNSNTEATKKEGFSRSKIGVLFTAVIILGVSSYFISNQFNDNHAQKNITENITVSQPTNAIENAVESKLELVNENSLVNQTKMVQIPEENLIVLESKKMNDSQFLRQDSTFSNELAALTSEEIEAYFLHENPEVLVETIY